jgi:hypothetical protein
MRHGRLEAGAAFVGAKRRPPSVDFATFDQRLADIARKAGFARIDAAEM